ncbi:MAG: ABC transporter substrate-binding protein [Anaerolineae bacterium]|nr:ABC transporter substrate-binding protein [Anaerolineae bacterium]
MRKALVTLLVTVLILGALPVFAQEGATELTLMGWSSSDAENTRLQKMIDTFNAEHEDIQVNLNLVPEYDTTLQAGLASGDPPDVFYVDVFRFYDLVGAGALASGEGIIETPDDFYPSLRNGFTYEGAFYCPPKDFSTLALFYNKDMFDAAGLEPPTTWDELRAAAEALTTEEHVGIVLPADFARWIAFLYAAGGSVTNEDFTEMTINSPEALEALEFYTNLILDGYGGTPSELDSGWPGEAFGKEKAAIAVEGNWTVPFMADNFPDVNYGVVELPEGPGGKATMAFTVCYAVAAESDNQEAAWTLVNWLTGPDGMKQWTDLGLAMPTRASLRDSWLEQFPNLEPFLAGAAYAHPWQFTAGFQDVLDTVNDNIQRILDGNQLPEDALEEIAEVGAEVLERAAED